MRTTWKRALVLTVLLSAISFANTPGRHTVLLNWTAATGGPPASIYNIYRGSVTGVCAGAPTPFASVPATQTSFTDQTPLATDFYAVSAVGTGGESACTQEVQVQVPAVTQGTPGNPTATVQ